MRYVNSNSLQPAVYYMYHEFKGIILGSHNSLVTRVGGFLLVVALKTYLMILIWRQDKADGIHYYAV